MISGNLRFTFVIPRYGADVLGGAERLARRVAEQLVGRGHHVRVLTTCAQSYRTWTNVYPAGMSIDAGIEVIRYRVAGGRSPFEGLLKAATNLLPLSAFFSSAWVRSQGPFVPELAARLSDEAKERDLLVFFQALAPTTVFGLPSVARKSALVPLLHDERGIHGAAVRATLRLPRAVLVNTDEEASLLAALTGIGTPAGPEGLAGSTGPAVHLAGIGLDHDTAARGQAPDLPQPYIVFLGRRDKIRPFVPTWRVLLSNRALPPLRAAGRAVPWSDVRLVIVGEAAPVTRGLPGVVHTGFVDDDTRWAILRNAAALINPSRFESLSLVLLEAWAVGKPVIVNAACAVTSGLVGRSQGGVIANFDRPRESARSIANALEQEERRLLLGRQGHAFAQRTFVWERVLDIYERVAVSL